jgi:hypothetical protein
VHTFLGALRIAAGLAVILAGTANIARTLVVPRAQPNRWSKAIDKSVDIFFYALGRAVASYEARDRLLAVQGPAVLLVQLAAWLICFEIGYSFVLWPFVHSFGAALAEAGSSMFTLGFLHTSKAAVTAADVAAAATGVSVLALQIAYLPTLYSAFNRRETEVTLLTARAGVPPWGPELLLRTRYGVAALSDDLPAFYERWERWAADVAESHSNYPTLVRFRSPRALSSWLVGLLAVMDSAAMLLALSPSRDRIEPRRAIRMGFVALREIGSALGIPVEEDPDPDAEIQVSFQEFAAAVEQLRAVGFPMEREPAEAFPHFRGWRVNYEALAYELAYRLDAVPALWSGPRRWPAKPVPPKRPPNRPPNRPPREPPPRRPAGRLPTEPGPAAPPPTEPGPAAPPPVAPGPY